MLYSLYPYGNSLPVQGLTVLCSKCREACIWLSVFNMRFTVPSSDAVCCVCL